MGADNANLWCHKFSKAVYKLPANVIIVSFVIDKFYAGFHKLRLCMSHEYRAAGNWKIKYFYTCRLSDSGKDLKENSVRKCFVLIFEKVGVWRNFV